MKIRSENKLANTHTRHTTHVHRVFRHKLIAPNVHVRTRKHTHGHGTDVNTQQIPIRTATIVHNPEKCKLTLRFGIERWIYFLLFYFIFVVVLYYPAEMAFKSFVVQKQDARVPNVKHEKRTCKSNGTENSVICSVASVHIYIYISTYIWKCYSLLWEESGKVENKNVYHCKVETDRNWNHITAETMCYATVVDVVDVVSVLIWAACNMR